MDLTKEEKQDLVQQAARKAWNDGGQWGLLAMATGTGKSLIAVQEATLLQDTAKGEANILLVVPTEKLRDNNWQDEFTKWNSSVVYDTIQRSCYASILKIEGQVFDLVILDEGHWLTAANSKFFQKNSIKRLLVLSATPPVAPNPKSKVKDSINEQKYKLFVQHRIKTDFYYPIEQARTDGLVADYEIWVVRTQLDNATKYIEAGPKAKRFPQTEKQSYDYLTKMIQKFAIAKNYVMVKVKSLERMRLIANSMEKLEACKMLLEKCKGNRILVFGGSIDQIEKLLPGQVYHSKSGKAGHAYLAKFMAEEVDECGTVAAANEGLNFPNLDIGLIAQISSDARALVQRIGRIIRFRPDHTSIIFIVVAQGTQDEKWLEAAFEGMDRSQIKYINAKDL